MSADPPPPAVYFLSDYGTADEFVGVVHAVVHRLAPSVRVIDLAHGIPPFDVGAGGALLARSVPHLGPGVVLAVVDPGVGTDRRAVAVGTPASVARRREDGPAVGDGPAWLVGPDNGLLVPAADALGGAVRLVEITAVPLGGGHVAGKTADGAPRRGATFDGRDVFAPAVAHLVTGGDPSLLGSERDPASLAPAIQAGGGPVDGGRPAGGAGPLVTTVGWVDHFGNVQLTLSPSELAGSGLVPGASVGVVVNLSSVGADARGRADGEGAPGHRPPRPVPARWVGSFAELSPGELGLMTDANGLIALVLDRASAAQRLGSPEAGAPVELWVE